MIEYALHCRSRADFHKFLRGISMQRMAPLVMHNEETDTYYYAEGLQVDEIGEIIQSPAHYDADGKLVADSIVIEGYHANIRIYGQIERCLLENCAREGNLFERTNILQYLKNPQPLEDNGFIDDDKIHIFDPSGISNRYRVWA